LDIDPVDDLAVEAPQSAALAELTGWLTAENTGRVAVLSVRVRPDPAMLRLGTDARRQLVADLGQLLRRQLRPKDRVHRVGLHEWLVLLPSLSSPAALILAMIRLVHASRQLPPAFSQWVPRLDLRCGGAIFQGAPEGPDDLLQSARIASLVAERREEGYAQYGESMEQEAAYGARLRREVGESLSAGSLQLFLQPQVHLETGHCVGAEALLRWRNHDAWVPPEVALGAIDGSGLRQAFTRWLFQRSAQIVRELEAAGIGIPISINLSADDLKDPDTVPMLAQVLDNVPASRIRVEITETTLVVDDELLHQQLLELQRRGVEFAIDDFGTGYSGMSHLRTLPAREIKIDQMFVRALTESVIDNTIVRTVIELGRQMEVTVLAEGVETQEVAERLHEMGCPLAQGYFFGRPMPVQDFIAWHAARRHDE
jgi:EAL domain-containing protein (putative c-di-GMP-specific phosphodiesterase class I)/GGDEF domain-containing protein